MIQGSVALKKILVVDDESLIRYSLMMMLQSELTEVRTASTGAEALIEVHSHFYDLCFLDIHLPDISGIDVLKELRDISPDTVVIIISANEPEEEGLMQQRKDKEYYIPKPFDLFQVKAFVDKVLNEGAHRYREETHAIKDYNAFVNWLVNDQRMHERKPIEKCITCMGISQHAEEKHSSSTRMSWISAMEGSASW
jgi:DNA-binding response OmpR family regulator